MLCTAEDLANHPFTIELKQLGVTDELLDSVRLSSNNHGRPFSQWSVRCRDAELSADAIALLKPYGTLKWLALEEPAASPEKEEALQFIACVLTSPLVQLALDHKEKQSQRASRLRGKLTDDGRTIRHIVEELVLKPESRDLTNRELWPKLHAELGELRLDPFETPDRNWRRSHLAYNDATGSRRAITGGRFDNLTRDIRKKHTLAGLT